MIMSEHREVTVTAELKTRSELKKQVRDHTRCISVLCGHALIHERQPAYGDDTMKAARESRTSLLAASPTDVLNTYDHNHSVLDCKELNGNMDRLPCWRVWSDNGRHAYAPTEGRSNSGPCPSIWRPH